MSLWPSEGRTITRFHRTMFEALSQHGAGQPLQNPKWEQLPPEIVQHIAWRLFSPECHSLGTLRLVCKSWRADLPAGLFPGLTMWQWEEDHGKCISQTTQDIRVSAPMLREDTLLALAPACPTLRSLTLDWIALPALRAAAPLFPHLKDLKASIYFGMHPNPETESLWLDWVPSLALLERLDLEAALEYDINSQMGLVYLKKLRKLRVLKLKNCAIMDDAVIPHLTCLENLAELSLVPSFFSADGLGVLCSSLPDLTIFGGCHKDCESAMKALTISKLETFNVKLHLGAVEAADFWTSGAKLLPSVTSFELLQENFKGGVPASFIGAAPLPQLRTLRYAQNSALPRMAIYKHFPPLSVWSSWHINSLAGGKQVHHAPLFSPENKLLFPRLFSSIALPPAGCWGWRWALLQLRPLARTAAPSVTWSWPSTTPSATSPSSPGPPSRTSPPSRSAAPGSCPSMQYPRYCMQCATWRCSTCTTSRAR